MSALPHDGPCANALQTCEHVEDLTWSNARGCRSARTSPPPVDNHPKSPNRLGARTTRYSNGLTAARFEGTRPLSNRGQHIRTLRKRMSLLTRRDRAVLLALAGLVVAVLGFATFGLTGWAVATLAILVGISAMVSRAQFAARRVDFRNLNRSNRGSREALKRIEKRTELARLAALSAREASLADSSDASEALRREISTLNRELSDVRSELRGVRVAQQLQSQTVVGMRGDFAVIMPQIDELVQHMSTDAELVLSRATPTSSSDSASAFAASMEMLDARLSRVTTSLEWEIRRQRADLVTDFQALNQLMHNYAPEAPLPPVSGWAMSPAGLVALTREIVQRDSQLVVECGSGTSTLWMALAMRGKGSGKVVALEHLQEYADSTRAMLEAHGVSEWVDVRVSPLNPTETSRGEFQWYNTADLGLDREIDILLVDGPPTTTGKHARYPALTVFSTMLDSGALIVMDDADRADEREVKGLWMDDFSNLAYRSSPERGVEVLVWNTPL